MFNIIKYCKMSKEDRISYKENYLEEKLQKEDLKAHFREEKHKIKEMRNSNRYFAKRLEKFTTSKLLMYLIFLNCTVIEVYSMYVMYSLSDLSSLYSLIGAVCGESLSYAIYSAKAFSETKEEAKNQLERDKFFYNGDDSDEDETKDAEEVYTEDSMTEEES